MKKGLLLFLLSLGLLAQEMPIAESNVFVYNKMNYGNSFLNGRVYYNEDQTGTLFCQPYGGAFFEIGNIGSSQAVTYQNNSYPTLQKVIFANGIQYFCTTKSIIAVRNKQSKTTFLLNKNKEFAHHFERIDNAFYYLNDYSGENPYLTLNWFDGKKVVVLEKIVRNKLLNVELVLNKNKLFLFVSSASSCKIYEVIHKKLLLVKEYSVKIPIGNIFNFQDVDNFDFYNPQCNFYNVNNGIVTRSNKIFKASNYYDGLFTKSINNQKYVYEYQNDSIRIKANTSWGDTFMTSLYSKPTNSYYCGTNGDLLRLFPHIKRFPRLFYNSNSNSVFALQQDYKNQIWAGSYQGVLSVITNDNKVVQSKTSTIKFLNGSLVHKNKLLFFAESAGGLVEFDGIEKQRVVTDNFAGYYAFVSKNKRIYLGTSIKGLWHTDLKNIEGKSIINWSKITDKQGLTIENILTITEDRFGNIWSAGRGISVYNPKTNKAITWKSNDVPEREFLKSCASRRDSYNNLWFGTRNGELVYYSGKNATDYDIKNFHFISHPLLEKGKTITFLHQWKHFLVLGASDKILLFDLQKWQTTQKVSVRYLNPIEINLTNNTEQNTILTDKRDESIWFASSDMLYQWDIKKWLTLPVFMVKPTISIQKAEGEFTIYPTKKIKLKPTENNFDLQIQFQTKDNMPRFLNGGLFKKGDKVVFENPNTVTKFSFKNLSSGDYVFYVRVCQQDGSYSISKFPIAIDSFVWNKWWFWVLVSLPFFGVLIYFFNRKNEIEKQKKELSQLNLASLSNQFRPHFMLNALNSIGSQMQDKPHAEKVISRLGESINVLYRFTQKNQFTLSFANEWKLVENSIEIQRLLFIPDLVCQIKNKNSIPKNYKIPVGLFQIPIENALLHGLRNKTEGECKLEITFEEGENHYIIEIKDNGVGRENASRINNFKKNGNGLKTISEMLRIINQNQKAAVQFEIIDCKEPTGTIVEITMNKTIDYDKIKI